MIIRALGFSPSVTDAPEPVIGYDNLVTAATLSSTTEDSLFPIDNLANPATNIMWKGGANTAGIETITVAIPVAQEIDYVAIANHNFGTEGFLVSVETDTATVLVEQTPITSDAPLILQFAPQLLSNLRVVITNSTQSVNPPEAGVIYVGKLLVLERSVKVDTDHIPISLGRRINVVSGMSETGNFLGRIVTGSYSESRAEFAHFTPDWYRAYFDPFVVAAQTTPFFWAWSPLEYPGETGFAWLTQDPQPEVSTVTRRVSVALNMRGLA